MAAPTTARFGAGFIELGDGATPTEVFTKICGFNEIEIAFDKDLNDTTVADCDNPDLPAWVERDVVSQSATFQCSGVAAREALPLLEAATLSGLSRNVRITVAGFGSGGPTPNKRYAGRFHCKHTLKGQRGNKWELDFEGESDGVVTIASVAAA
jgi:hypothetical protein